MLALRWHGTEDVRLDEIPAPEPPGTGWLQLEVIACGICGTDVEEYLHGPTFIPHAEPNRLTGAVAPIVLGHEIAGRVIAVGPGTPDFAVGDVVGVDGLMGCGGCSACTRGEVNLCGSLAAVGLMSDGGLAEQVNVRADTCVKIPAGAPDETGALAETLAVAVRALRRGRLAHGERVLIFGAGAVGLFALQAARAMGASQVAVVEPHERRRTLALELGASDAWPLGSEVLEADVVVECSGVPEAFGTALAATRRGGRLVLVGVSTAPVAVAPMEIVAGEREVIGSLSHLRETDFAAAVELLVSGAVRTDGIVTSRIPLAHALDEGLMALVREPERHVKILVVPTANAATQTESGGSHP